MRLGVLVLLAGCCMAFPACRERTLSEAGGSSGGEASVTTGNMEVPYFRNTFELSRQYPKIDAERAVIYMPEGSWSYVHHPSVACFQGLFHVVYSNGMRGEDEPGQRVMYATSPDFIHWSEPVVLAEPGPGDYGTDKILTPGGIRVCNGRLTVYVTENDNDGVSNQRLNPRLFVLASPDGKNWWHPVETDLAVFPCQRPLLAASGRYVMTCNRSFYYTEDPYGTEGWRKCGTASQDQHGETTFEQVRPSLCEGMLFEHADGTLYCLFRNSSSPFDGYLWQAQSYDGGLSWTMPVKSGFSDNGTKSFFGTLPDGRYLYVGTPDNTSPGTRYPLVVALSDDGFEYDTCYILSDDHYEQQYDGRWKNGDYGYPFALVRDGWVYVVVSRHKERLDALKFKWTDLEKS